MDIDPIIISSILGISGYLIQNWVIKKREREMQLKILKISLYEKLISKSFDAMHIVTIEKGKTPPELRKEINILMNTLYLYGSKEVLEAADNLISNPTEAGIFKSFILKLVNEIRQNKLEESDIRFFLWN